MPRQSTFLMLSLRPGFWRFWNLYIKWRRRTMISGQNYCNLSVCLITKSFTTYVVNVCMVFIYCRVWFSWSHDKCACVWWWEDYWGRGCPWYCDKTLQRIPKGSKDVLTPTSYWVHLSSLCKFHEVLMDQFLSLGFLGQWNEYQSHCQYFCMDSRSAS